MKKVVQIRGMLQCHGCGCNLDFQADWWDFFGDHIYCFDCIPDKLRDDD